MKTGSFFLLLLFIIGCHTSPKTDESTKHKADPALAAMEENWHRYPDSTALADRLIDTLLLRKDYEGAAGWCDSLVKRDPDRNINYMLMKADIYRMGKIYQKAIPAYNQYLRIKGDEPIPFLTLANTLAEAGDTSTLSFCAALWQRFPTPEVRTGICFVKGVYFNTTRQYNQAIRWLDSTIRYDYTFTNAYFEKGYAQYDAGEFAGAANTFRQLLAINPQDADGWYWLGKSFDTLHQTEKAIAAYSKSFGLDSTIIEAQLAINRLSQKR